MQPRHRAVTDVGEAVSQNQIGAEGHGCHDRGQVLQVVRIIGVRHHQDVVLRRGESLPQRGPISANRRLHHAGARPVGDHVRPVARSIVDHHHFARSTAALKPPQRLCNAGAYGGSFVETGQDNADAVGPDRRCVGPRCLHA